MSDLPPSVLRETGRFAIDRCLGRGGFGVVYEAYDRQRHARVALKFLTRPDLGSLYRLKQEFRALADLSHPNLVALHELYAEADQWFIVMELVEGLDFISHVSNEPYPASQDSISTGISEIDQEAETGSRQTVPSPPPRAPSELACDLRRLEAATRQLAQALSYLHSAGKLHRDIKPRNVLVTRQGQVKLLDFGLATELAADAAADSVEILGTPAFMAPEQTLNQPLTEASDWYSVGVMLFRALTGQLPFAGPFFELVQAKQRRDAPVPSSLVHGIPPPLTDLCCDLLARRPELRPTDAEVFSRLDEIWPPQISSVRLPAQRPARGVFVGRADELDALADALDRTKSGRAVTVYVHGSSGMGKSALVNRFLGQVRARERGAVVLAGRCYERESVPYKGLDSLVDALTQYLRKLSRAEAEALLPRDVAALARLFPILRRVEAVALARQRGLEIADSQELRRRGFAAFRELVARLSDRHPVVMFIDDLQWGDTDSAALIVDLMRPPDPPPLLLVASYRSEEVASSAALRMLLPRGTPAGASDHEVREVAVGELTEAEARQLAEALMGAQAPPDRIEAIVRESRRSPFFIDELVQYSAVVGRAEPVARPAAPADTVGATELTLESVIRGRAGHLAPAAHRLLQVLAVFGGPLHASLASQAAELASEELDAIAALRAVHLARLRMTEAGEELDIYHDRIRETLVAQLPSDQLQAIHGRLALVLATSSAVDPETLVVHFQGAGQLDRAAVYALAAADRARDALAFDRAARLYRVTLDLRDADPSARRAIQIKLGDALAAGGRGYEAAQAYLGAAEGALAAMQLELRRRAAEQMLRSGYIEEGFRAIRAVLDVMGMKLAGSPARALLSLLVRRAQIKLRGLRFRERDRSQIAPEELVRVDACWSVATAIGVVDTIRGADFQGRHLLLALRTGDPYRIARAIAIEAAYAGAGGEDTRARHEKLAALAQGLAERVDQPQAIALVTLVKGMSAFLQGRWKIARELLERADAILRERCTGVAWELDTAHLYYLLALSYLGEIRELCRHLPRFLKEAHERDDLTAATNLRTRIAYLMHLAADDPEPAREEVRQGMARWTREGFHAQHSWELYARGEIELYAGQGPEAWRYVNDRWPALRRSLLLRIQGARIESLYLRARSALAAGLDRRLTPAERHGLFRAAERDARRLARESAAWAPAVADLVRAGVAASRGDRPRAVSLLTHVESRFEAADMALHAVVVRRRRGELLGGPQGPSLVQEADAWMSAQAIRNPARMAAMLAPGLYTSGEQP